MLVLIIRFVFLNFCILLSSLEFKQILYFIQRCKRERERIEKKKKEKSIEKKREEERDNEGQKRREREREERKAKVFYIERINNELLNHPSFGTVLLFT